MFLNAVVVSVVREVALVVLPVEVVDRAGIVPVNVLFDKSTNTILYTKLGMVPFNVFDDNCNASNFVSSAYSDGIVPNKSLE